MTKYTPNYSIPYPTGSSSVAVHSDVEALAVKSDVELQRLAHEAALLAERVAEQEAPPKIPVNLVNMEDTISGNMGAGGTIWPHSSNRVTRFIPVKPGRQYSSMLVNNPHMIVWFDENQNNILGTNTDYIPPNTHETWIAPSNAAYVRVGISVTLEEDYREVQMIFNQGPILIDPDSPDDYPGSGYWDDRELPPAPELSEASLQRLVSGMLPQWEPSTPTLDFETIYTGWSKPVWLTSDGAMIYASRGPFLEQSDNEFETLEIVHEFPNEVGAVRELDTGELLVSTLRSPDRTEGSKVWKSSGYTRQNPSAATWTEVLEADSRSANITGRWGFQVYQNVCIAAEYGLRDVEGSRRVWMSEDRGDTWDLVFDQMLDTPNIPGAPEWTPQAHLHGAAWDPYWSRLWVICGDGLSTGSYYSDDKGDTWHFIVGTERGGSIPQFTGIMPLPDAVIFGSDGSPNGVWAYHRGHKSEMPSIDPVLIVNDKPSISHIFGFPYKKDWGPTTPTYFDAHSAHGEVPSMIVGFVDARKAHILWEAVSPNKGGELSGHIRATFGATAQGNIITYMDSDPTVRGYRVMKSPAPTWARA